MWSATVALYKCRIKADLRDRAEKSGRGRNGNRQANSGLPDSIFHSKLALSSID